MRTTQLHVTFCFCISIALIHCLNEGDSIINSLPQQESCDGKDNDKDGWVDEDFDLDGDGFVLCENKDITNDCNDESHLISPIAFEKCDDNIDNDCDKKVDEQDEDCSGNCGTLNLCEKQEGVCAGIGEKCVSDHQVCEYQKNPKYQVTEFACIDGLDNDCDGKADTEDTDCQQFGACSANQSAQAPVCKRPGNTESQGICRGVLMSCMNRYWNCDFSAISGFEFNENSVDQIDNDCDGNVDEDDMTYSLGEVCSIKCLCHIDHLKADGSGDISISETADYDIAIDINISESQEASECVNFCLNTYNTLISQGNVRVSGTISGSSQCHNEIIEQNNQGICCYNQSGMRAWYQTRTCEGTGFENPIEWITNETECNTQTDYCKDQGYNQSEAYCNSQGKSADKCPFSVGNSDSLYLYKCGSLLEVNKEDGMSCTHKDQCMSSHCTPNHSHFQCSDNPQCQYHCDYDSDGSNGALSDLCSQCKAAHNETNLCECTSACVDVAPCGNYVNECQICIDHVQAGSKQACECGSVCPGQETCETVEQNNNPLDDCTGKDCGAGNCFTGSDPHDGGWGCNCNNETTLGPSLNPGKCTTSSGGNSGTTSSGGGTICQCTSVTGNKVDCNNCGYNSGWFCNASGNLVPVAATECCGNPNQPKGQTDCQ